MFRIWAFVALTWGRAHAKRAKLTAFAEHTALVDESIAIIVLAVAALSQIFDPAASTSVPQGFINLPVAVII